MTHLAKILSHLPAPKILEIETITQRIVDTGKAEFVVLFGSYARGNYREKQGKIRGKKSDYDIFAVTAAESRSALEGELRGKFDDIAINVQVIIEDIDFVNSNLSEGQFFFTDIKREGKILYTSGRYTLAEPRELSPTRRREIAEADFEKWHGDAGTFFETAGFCTLRGAFRVAAFNYQQVAELCYTAVEMVFTHYQPHEHNLGILRQRAGNLDSRILDALPCDTDAQWKLFEHLNFAYIGGRYRSDAEYPVTETELDYWAEEAKWLLEITENVCQERIEALRQIERND